MILGILGVLALGVYLLMGTDQDYFHYTSYALFGVGFLLFVVMIFLRKKINMTAALFSETCAGVQNNPGVFVTSTITFAIVAGFLAYWLATSIYLYSIPGTCISYSS